MCHNFIDSSILDCIYNPSKSVKTNDYLVIKKTKRKKNDNTKEMSKTPSYYIGKYKGIHVQDVLVDFELTENHNLASAVEYILRCTKKHETPEQDIKKAIHHLELYLQHPKFTDCKHQTTPKE